MAWKEIKSNTAVSIVEDAENKRWGVHTESEGGGSSSTVFFSTEDDAKNALSLMRRAIRDGHSGMWTGRKVMAKFK